MTTIEHKPANVNTKSQSLPSPRPTVSPLLQEWAKHPQRITDAILDTAASVEIGKALRHELDACGRGQVHPDAHGLRMVWAYLAIAGCYGLLDKQRAWHREHGARSGGAA
ncbi:MAG: hypothetical protein AAGA29_04925 [Planctomycetota bacterium]